MKFCVLAVIGTLYSAAAVDGGVSTKEAISNHLPTLRHETFAIAIDTLRAGRKYAAASRKLEGHTTTDGDTFRMLKKRAKAAKSKSAKASEDDSSLFTNDDVQAKLDTCEAELETYKAAEEAPHWLFVQMADTCVMYLKDGVYYLESSNFHKDTEGFTDRPMQLEKTLPTSEWFNYFNNELFDDGKGMPNAALTFVDDDESKDVVVSVFAEGYTKEGEGDVDVGVLTHGYKLDQSSSQKKVLALESLMNGQDSVEFDHCSMFIDDWLYCDTFDCANDAPCLGFNCLAGFFCCL